MRLVQHPTADLSLSQCSSEGRAAELFGRRQDDTRVPKAHAIQRGGTLGHGEKTVNGDGRPDALGFHSLNLVRHQSHKW